MSHSSSGLRGVTLNDLFVVTAKRATDMRSLAEPVHGKMPNPAGHSTAYYLFNWLFTGIAQGALFLSAYTLGDALLPMAARNVETISYWNAQFGGATVTAGLAALIWTVAHLLFGEWFFGELKECFPRSPESQPDAERGYIARAFLPHAAISQGTLKVTYSVTPDALVIRSLKDHAITVISMEMICRVFVGDLAVFDDEHDHKIVSGCGHSHSGDPDCCGEFDARDELTSLKIDEAEKLGSWYQGKTKPVVVSLKSGHAKIPLIIHGLYFDGLASANRANEKFVDEFNAALCAFRKSQAGHGDHGHGGHDDHGHGHGGHGGGHH